MLPCVRVIGEKQKLLLFKHENYAWQFVYFGCFYRSWLDLTLAIHPLPSRLLYGPIHSSQQGSGDNLRAGERQSRWSWEPSVITPFSLVQLASQKVKPCFLWYKKDAERHTDNSRLEERQNWADLLLWLSDINPFGDGRRAEWPSLQLERTSRFGLSALLLRHLILISSGFVLGENWLGGHLCSQSSLYEAIFPKLTN